jgi:hypothetical protein
VNRKPLTELTREELIDVCYKMATVIQKQSKRFHERWLKDLPPCRRANERHQRHKRAWGKRKTRLMQLLSDCFPLIDSRHGNVLDRIKYELDLNEDQLQRRANRRNRK